MPIDAACLRRCVASLLLLIALGPAATAMAQPIPAQIDSVGTALTEGRPGGAVIGVLAADTVTLAGRPVTGRAVFGFGAVDSSGITPTARTLFEIGSVTKTFTGLLLADAIEQGAAQPDDPTQAFLPDTLNVPTHASGPVTLEHLTTHRSGLPRLPSNLQASALANPQDPYANYSARDLHAFLDGYALSRAPGAAYAYSNLGAGLLGHLLARAADTSFAALVQARIARPLGLADTRVHLTAEQRARFAQGYDGAGRSTPPWHLPALGGAGALRSTASDMLTYAHVHLTASDRTALGRALQRAMTPIAEADLGVERFAGTRIGYGWHVTPRSDATVTWHNGGTGGFSSFVGFSPEAGVGVVILANAGAMGAEVTSAGFALMEALLPAAPSAQP